MRRLPIEPIKGIRPPSYVLTSFSRKLHTSKNLSTLQHKTLVEPSFLSQNRGSEVQPDFLLGLKFQSQGQASNKRLISMFLFVRCRFGPSCSEGWHIL